PVHEGELRGTESARLYVAAQSAALVFAAVEIVERAVHALRARAIATAGHLPFGVSAEHEAPAFERAHGFVHAARPSASSTSASVRDSARFAVSCASPTS